MKIFIVAISGLVVINVFLGYYIFSIAEVNSKEEIIGKVIFLIIVSAIYILFLWKNRTKDGLINFKIL